MKKIALVVGLAATLFATAAQAMTVQEFLTAAARIPRNPTALLRADTRRLLGLAISASLNAPVEDTKFGVFRM